ncbi:TonB-dependent siderophore receptor [Paracidovorax anthurii]|uniref:Iron complex outermembrane receptor protein n=1 Tax=Paracidovorax anthurii TaxID=78229 RepID=A0A328Z6A9_9BURK|nr:TonB-dependent siderophore receptor [Paracidovorax anthurii]RAR80993.1 iron complex outermembrane receptor protein [Paracidovorax anthurii]
MRPSCARPLPLAIALAFAIGSPALHAQADSAGARPGDTVQVRIEAQPLAQALNAWARQTRMQVAVRQAAVAGKSAPAVSGDLSAREALDRLLEGSGLRGRFEGNLATIEATTAGAAVTLQPVVVTAQAARESADGPVVGYVARRSAAGSKTDTPLSETPQSISVVGAEQIEAMGAARLGDALAYTPGVDVAANGTDSRFDWLTLRGFDLYSPGFYLDGLPLRNIGTWSVWQTENYAAERIEVLRGPASVLYGMGNVGGTVNVVSKRPTANPQRELQLQWGDHGRKQVMGDFSGPLDEAGTLLYRVTGLLRDAELPAGGMRDDRAYLAPSLAWRPSGDTRLVLQGHYLRVRSGVYTRGRRAEGSLYPTPAGTTVPASFSSAEPGFDHFEQDQWALGYAFEHDLGSGWTVRQNARYGRLDVDLAQVSVNGYEVVDGSDPLAPANFRRATRGVFAAREKARGFAIDNQLQGTLRLGEWRHQVLLGLEHQRSTFDTVARNGSAPSIDLFQPVYGQPVVLPDPYQDTATRLTQTGLYVQDQIKWRDRWVITLGGRYDTARTAVEDRLSEPAASTRVSDHKASARGGVVYLAPQGWAPYVSYTTSFLPIGGAMDPATGRPFKPETSRQYEAGVRYQPPGRNDSYSAAVFDLRRQNYITYDPSFAPRQTGEVQVRGLELSAQAQPLRALNLVASYTFTPKADVTASAKPEEIGRQLIAMSRHKASIWVDYRFASGLKAGIGARYTGSNRGNGEAVAPHKVPAFTVFDALLGYDFERWSVALNLRNLTDKTYIANCDAYGGCYYGEPRRATLSATYRW